MDTIRIANRHVGVGQVPYVIAEIGSNHNGDIDLCRRLIDAAIQSKADAVKFQSWSSRSLVSKAEYARNTSYADKKRHFGSLKEMVDAYQLTPAQHREVASYCTDKNIHFLSSAFSCDEVDLLVDLDVPAIKVASMDVNHIPLLEHIGKSRKPVIVSTGMAGLGDIECALDTLQSHGSGEIALLHCISIYPPKHADINLRNIEMLRTAFEVPVGFSDHSVGTSIALASIALGASIVEKHFTLDKEMEGWDHWISADPSELSTLVAEGRNVFQSLGASVRRVSNSELEKRLSFRRRAVLRRDVTAGSFLTLEDIDFKRPGTGIHPTELAYIVGRTLKRDLRAEDELDWEDLV